MGVLENSWIFWSESIRHHSLVLTTDWTAMSVITERWRRHNITSTTAAAWCQWLNISDVSTLDRTCDPASEKKIV